MGLFFKKIGRFAKKAFASGGGGPRRRPREAPFPCFSNAVTPPRPLAPRPECVHDVSEHPSTMSPVCTRPREEEPSTGGSRFAGLASPRHFVPNRRHAPPAERGGSGAARGGAAGEPRAAQGASAPAPGWGVAPAPGRGAAAAPGRRCAPGSSIAVDRGRCGTGQSGGDGVPRFRRICRGQAVRVSGSGVRLRPARLRRTPRPDEPPTSTRRLRRYRGS
jgi:hypothetical protein